jgi:hypothetical protein
MFFIARVKVRVSVRTGVRVKDDWSEADVVFLSSISIDGRGEGRGKRLELGIWS